MHSTLTRRRFIGVTATSAAALALVGCTPAQVQAVAQAVISDTALVAKGLQSILPTVAAVVGIPPVTVTLVTTIVGDIASVASQVAQAASQNVAQPLVTQIGADISTLLGAVANVAIPANVKQVITAAEALLPTIEAAVGIATTLIAAPRDAAAQISPDQARLILAAAAK